MTHRHGATVAAFLQQAEENLAILSARTRSEGVPWPDFQAHPYRVASPGYVAAGAVPAVEATALPSMHRAQTPSPRLVVDDAGLSPRLLDGMARRCAGSRVELDDAFRRLEDKEVEAKEQMDVQAKMMLGIDRKVKAFDGRMRAVEAGVAAAADIASASSSTAQVMKSFDSRLSAVESTIKSINPAPEKTVQDAAAAVETRCSELERRFDGLAATVDTALRDATTFNAPHKQLADLQRRAAALAEGARRDREASRQHTKGLVDELKRNVRNQLDDFERRIRVREERLSEETRQHAGEVGRQLAGELLNGPVSDLVERRVQRTEEAMVETARAVHNDRGTDLQRDLASRMQAAEEKLQSLREAAEVHVAEIARQAISKAVTEVTWESIQETAEHAAREAAAQVALQTVVDANKERSANRRDFNGEQLDCSAHSTSGSILMQTAEACAHSSTPGGLLMQTAQRVAELETRGQGEEQAYWATVQALDARVAGLEEEIGQMLPSANSEHTLERVRTMELEISQMRRRRSPESHVGAVVQDLVAAQASDRRHLVTNSSPRKMPAYHADSRSRSEPDPGLIISPRALSTELTKNSATKHDRWGVRDRPFSGRDTSDLREVSGAVRPPRLPLSQDEWPRGRDIFHAGPDHGEQHRGHVDPNLAGGDPVSEDAFSECGRSDRSERSNRSRASQQSRQSRASHRSQRSRGNQHVGPGSSEPTLSSQTPQATTPVQAAAPTPPRSPSFSSSQPRSPTAAPSPPRSPAASLPRTPPPEISIRLPTMLATSVDRPGSSHHGSSCHDSVAGSQAGDSDGSAPWDAILKNHQWEAAVAPPSPSAAAPSTGEVGSRAAEPQQARVLPVAADESGIPEGGENDVLEEDEEEDYLEEDESEDEEAEAKARSLEKSAGHARNTAPPWQAGGHLAPAAPVHYGPAVSAGSSRAQSEVDSFGDDEELPI